MLDKAKPELHLVSRTNHTWKPRSTGVPRLAEARRDGASEAGGEPGADVDSTTLFLRALSSTPLLTRAEEVSLSRRARTGDPAARDRLVMSNLRLVASIAQRFRGNALEFTDLVQEGTIGLVIAVDRFDPDRGHKLSTYATWWIRKTIFQACADKGRTVRMPLHRVLELNRIVAARRQLSQELQREPTPRELADAANLPAERVQELLRADRMSTSLEGLLAIAPGAAEADRADSDPVAAVLEDADAAFRSDRMRRLVADLEPLSRRIVELRYGLTDGVVHSLTSAGSQLGLSRERIRQLEAVALKELREHPDAGCLRTQDRELDQSSASAS